MKIALDYAFISLNQMYQKPMLTRTLTSRVKCRLKRIISSLESLIYT